MRLLNRYVYYEAKDLVQIFSLETLQKLYRAYVDSDPDMYFSRIETLANLLTNKIQKPLYLETKLRVNILVTDFSGNVYRVVQLDDLGLGGPLMPLVFDLETNKTFPYSSPLFHINPIEYAETVDEELKSKLNEVCKTTNYFRYQGNILTVGTIYIFDNSMAEDLLKAECFYMLIHMQ